MIAAARLGLDVCSCGHAGCDEYGAFLFSCLAAEGIRQQLSLTRDIHDGSILSTLVCFVLVHATTGQHTFCSRYDMGPWPLLSDFRPSSVHSSIFQAFSTTRAVMMNGFVFDELSPDVVHALAQHARSGGALLFFDPGPRSATLVAGERRAALDAVLDVSAVVLMTQEEAEAITGCRDPEAACLALLLRPGCATQWVIVKLGPEGSMLGRRAQGRGNVVFSRQKGFAVDVQDTVGCGDSFAAAVVLGYIRGWRSESVLALANAVGAATATTQGAGRGVADRETVERLLHDASQGKGGWAADCFQALTLLREE